VIIWSGWLREGAQIRHEFIDTSFAAFDVKPRHTIGLVDGAVIYIQDLLGCSIYLNG
jgi:hypothetical protein